MFVKRIPIRSLLVKTFRTIHMLAAILPLKMTIQVPREEKQCEQQNISGHIISQLY